MKSNKSNNNSGNRAVKVEIASVVRRLSSGWGVLNVLGDDGDGNFTKRGKAAGEFPEQLGPGDIVELTGYWDHSKYGLQFKFSKIEMEPPCVNTAGGIIRLLQKLPWIGPVKAQAAVEEHGHDLAWDYAQKDPAKLGVSASRCEQVMDAAKKLLSGFEEQVYFLSLGLTQGQINKLVLEYGPGRNGAMKVMKETPYKALEVDGFGFLTVDLIALRAGVNPVAEGRLSACVEYFLEDSGSNAGHIWFYRKELISGSKRYSFYGVLKILNKGTMDAMVPMGSAPTVEDLDRILLTLESEGKIKIVDGKIYNAKLMAAEKAIGLAAMGEQDEY